MKYTLDLLPLRAFQGRGTPVGGRGLRLHGGSDMGNQFYETDNSRQAAADAAYEAYHAPAPEPAWSPPPEAYNPPPEAYNPPPEPAWSPPPAPAAPNWNQTISDIYQQEFGRAPDASGIASFTAALNAGLTGEQMREALRTSTEGQSMGLAPAAPTGIASLPAAAKPAQWELQPESYDEFTGAYNAPYYIDVNSGATKAVGQPVQATGVTPVDPNTLAQHVGPNFQGTPTQFYDEQGNLKGVLVDAVRAGLNTREGELILDPMSLGLALKPGEKASLNSALQQRNEQGQLLFIDPNTGGTTIYNTGVPAETGSTVKDLLYINERKYGGQIPADTAQGMLLLASMALTGGVGGALMNAAGLGAGAGLTAAEAAALMGGTLSEAGAAATMGAGGLNLSAMATSAAKSAALNAGMTALKGGSASDIFKSGLIGAVSGGAGSAVGDLGLGSLETTLAKAGLQAGITGLTGGNVANSLIASAVGAALPAALDKIIPEGTFDGLPPTIKNALTSATASAVTAASTGGNISDAALNSILSSAGSAATDYVAEATGFKGLTLKQAAEKVDGYFNDVKANVTMGDYTDSQTYKDYIDSKSAGSSESDDGAGGVPDTSDATNNSALSDQLFKDVFGTPSTTTPAQNNAPFDLDTGYRAEALPVAAPVNSEFAPLEAGPLDKETQAQVDAIAAKQQQKNYSAGLNAKLSNVNSIINLVPDTLGLFTGIAKSIEAEIKAATSALATSTEYTRPTDAQISAIFKAAQDFYAPIRNLVFDATQVDAASPEAKSGLITKTLNGIGEIMHAASVPIAEATGMPVEYVESVLALAGPKIVGKTFNVASALGADIASGSWGNALSSVMNKAENLGIVPKAEMYVVEPKQGLGSLGAKPFAEAEGGIAALLKDYKPTNTPLLDSLLAREKPAMSLVDSLLKDYKPNEPIPAGVKSQVKTSVDNVYTGLAKDAPSVPMSEFLQTLVYGGASLKDVGAAVDLAMQGSGGGGGNNNPDTIIQEVSKATEDLDDAKKIPATFAFLVNAGILGVTPSTAIESGWLTDAGELTDSGADYLAETQPYPQEQLQPAQQEQPALQTETQPVLQEPVNTIKEFEDPPAPPPPPPPPPSVTPPSVTPPSVNPPPAQEIDPVDGTFVDVTPVTGDPESPANKAKAKAQSKLKFNRSLNMALQSVQGVQAKTPPGAEIDYLYDIGGESIFAPMKKESKYLPREGYYDPQVERQYAQGGSIDDLYDMLRSK